jgi:hypothetical protein
VPFALQAEIVALVDDCIAADLYGDEDRETLAPMYAAVGLANRTRGHCCARCRGYCRGSAASWTIRRGAKSRGESEPASAFCNRIEHLLPTD